jgi:hypothetical protein
MFDGQQEIRWGCNLHPWTPVSKRINVTLPDAIFAELELWAEAQGRPTANLAAYLIEAGMRQAKLEGEFRLPEKNGNPSPRTKKALPTKSKGDK